MRFRGAFLVVAIMVLVMACGDELPGDEEVMVENFDDSYEVELPSGMEFVSIPSGSFRMGSSSSDVDSERPVHTVYIDEFEMMTTEVTQGMWEEVMGESIYDLRDATYSICELNVYGVGDNYPVYYVGWNECQEFIDRLNDMDPGHTYRLPSESEWEYACRAGTTTEYYWGDSSSESVMGQYCWYRLYGESRDSGSTHPVAQKLPNAWGLYDMIGNVKEWCEDKFHSNYYGAPTNGSAWRSGITPARVIRGGWWDSSSADFCRSASRCAGRPIPGAFWQGFRLSRDSAEVGETVSEPTPVVSAEVRFSQSGSVITDNETNLQWRVGPDSGTDWYEAEDWVDNLGGDWRMPTVGELTGLWDAGISIVSWEYFEIRGSSVWSGEVRDSSSACGFNFYYGRENWIYHDDSAFYWRAFAVRP